jgi:flavin-dependent dehydrogenase
MASENYDVIIIGGGMAGCILATRIAENGVDPETGLLVCSIGMEL